MATHVRRLIGVVHHQPTEQHAVSFGSGAAVAPSASELVKGRSHRAMVATMDQSALPEGDGLPVPEADRA